MPLFAIIGSDVANSDKTRRQLRMQHIARLTDLMAQNRLIIAGPTPITHDDNATHDNSAISGSIIIADFDDLASVQAWVDDEPYLLGGVYSHVEIRPFVQALPKRTS